MHYMCVVKSSCKARGKSSPLLFFGLLALTIRVYFNKGMHSQMKLGTEKVRCTGHPVSLKQTSEQCLVS